MKSDPIHLCMKECYNALDLIIRHTMPSDMIRAILKKVGFVIEKWVPHEKIYVCLANSNTMGYLLLPKK